MHNEKRLMALLAAGSLVFGAGIALAASSESTEYSQKPEASKATHTAKETAGEKETASDRTARGTVTAVEPSANPATLTLKVMRGKQEETIGVDVPAGVKIHEGKAVKTLSDIKLGDQVWMKYDRTSDKLIADSIRILRKPAKVAARKVSTETTVATPAASH
jgi:hypothetical protein